VVRVGGIEPPTFRL